ncbi:hypothetical protein Glove_441g48 [Diversispora epigaea]|uniref:Protein kinase domain-containing protein n=1 Tax=Diversispora epigaea TaxID=1348612 RepID=A0A397GSK1_9GLOM|nr:hypothetical protein Glove_441g48 [Diversispora epigaea]
MDKFIQDVQLNANCNFRVIEWISYNRFKDVKQIDIENQQWERYDKMKEVVLKKFDNIVNFNDVLNEMKIHLKTWNEDQTQSYMMVLEYAADGNLREYLKINFNNINWERKLYNLKLLSLRLMRIHELDIVHQDFHPGNILSSNFKSYDIRISDFGLSKLIGTNPNNPKKKNIVGVLSYIAPEVLSAADVYSFGIIAYEIVTGFPPYPDIPYDKDLAMKICNGL